MSKRTITTEDSTDFLKQYLPTSFGKIEETYDSNSVINKTRKRKVKVTEANKFVGPSAPEPRYEFGKNNPPQIEQKEEEKKEEEEKPEYEEYDENNPFSIPFSHEVMLKGHDGIVTALGLDPSGARLLSGGYDQSIKFWDFPAMDVGFKHFRSIEPPDDVIHTLQYSKTGDRFLMAGSSPQARIYDRDGHELVEFVKGYPYISDMASTKGHVSRITCAFWHPTSKETIVTGSQDSSIRIWDVNHHKNHKQIIKLRNHQGASKAPVMACAMSQDGKHLVAVGQDGSLQLFPAAGPYTRPKQRVPNAHEPNSETSCVAFKGDNITFLTRGADDTLKVWDVRNSSVGPLKVFSDLPNKYPEADCLFSPDNKLFATGTSVIHAKEDVGKIIFFDSTTLSMVKEVSVSSGSVVSLIWHPEINQIICGCSDKSIHVLYDPKYSQKGILYTLHKIPKKKRIEDGVTTCHIMNPHALPMFKQAPSARRQREKARMDPVKAHIPEAPQIGPGSGGRLGSSLTASIMKNLVKKDVIDDDPRAALLKYANTESYWFRAYQDTQPVPIFDTASDEEAKTEQKEPENEIPKLNN